MIGIVRGRDHDPEISTQRAGHLRYGRRRQGAKLENIHPHRGETGHQRGFDHVSGQACILSDNHRMSPTPPRKIAPGRLAQTQSCLRGHREGICQAPDTISPEVFLAHGGFPAASVRYSHQYTGWKARFGLDCIAGLGYGLGRFTGVMHDQDS